MRRAVLCAAVLAGGCQSRWDGVLSALSDPDPRQRAEAVRRVARSGTPDDLASLILRVNDPAPEARAAIAQALGSLDNRQSSDALAALVTDESESVQLEAVAALARHRDPRAHHYLLLAYQQDGPQVRARIAELLAAHGGSPAEAVSAEADALYARYSKELAGSGTARLLAAERLGSSGRAEAIDRLTSYLGAESRSLATAAARGLGASGSPEARGPLEALLNEEDPALRLAGAEALGELGDVQAALALSRAIERNDLVGRAALRSLGKLARLAGLGPGSTSTQGAQATDLLCGVVMGPDVALARQAAHFVHEAGAGCSAARLEARLLKGGEVGGVLAGMAVLWASDGDPATEPAGGGEKSSAGTRSSGDRGRLSLALGSLLRRGGAQVRPLAADVIGVLDLSVLAPDVERARDEAGLEVQRAREHWVKGVAPSASSANAPSLFSPDPQAALFLWAETTAAEIRMSEVNPLPQETVGKVSSAVSQGARGQGEGTIPEAGALATALASDPAPSVRLAAARSVLWLSSDLQWQILAPLLDDADPDVRQAARADLAKLAVKAGDAGQWLLTELNQATPEADAVPLVEAASGFRGLPGLDDALVRALDRPDTAPAAAAALSAVGDAGARSAILSHLKRPFALALPELLAAAARQSWDRADAETAATACRSLLFHTRPEVRAAAVRALLTIAGPGAAGDVQALATDYDVRVRRAVATTRTP